MSQAKSRWRLLAMEGARLSKVNARPANQQQAEQFSAMYRRSATELARVRAFSPNRRLAEYLETAVATAHFAMYRKEPAKFRDAVWGFLGTVPALIRKHWRYHILIILFTALSTGIAFAAVMATPDSYFLFVDAQLAAGRDPYASRESLKEVLDSRNHDLSTGAAFSSMLFTHNTQVAFMCFALGLLLGLPTLYLIFKNGLMLGAFAAIYVRADLTWEFLAWILPHGLPEFGAIFLCAGSGLVMGHRLMNPGELPRRIALSRAAGEASIMAMGAVPLLLAAGLIEGIFRQSDASMELRYALFGTLAVVIGVWLFVGGRRINKVTA
ncbi:MAG: stage II sporulation protein M [Planctomycetes bacterium]|nr:stage II sporulation protein M [Planctomycetota bacterium]